MLDITFKSTEEGLYELRAQFGTDVDPDALLTSIESFIKIVKRASPAQTQNHPKLAAQPKKEGGVNVGSLASSMSGANKAFLVSLYEYEQEHQEPIEVIWEIKKYTQKFKAYTDFVKGKSRKQEVISLRYQLRLLREKGLMEESPSRALTPLGISVAQRAKADLKLVAGYSSLQGNAFEIDEAKAGNFTNRQDDSENQSPVSTHDG